MILQDISFLNIVGHLAELAMEQKKTSLQTIPMVSELLLPGLLTPKMYHLFVPEHFYIWKGINNLLMAKLWILGFKDYHKFSLNACAVFFMKCMCI